MSPFRFHSFIVGSAVQAIDLSPFLHKSTMNRSARSNSFCKSTGLVQYRF